MARADQVKALLRAYAGDEAAHFISVALQVAADEAQRGHTKLAAELRDLIEEARAKSTPRSKGRLLPIAQPRGERGDLLTVQYRGGYDLAGRRPRAARERRSRG